MGKLAWGMGAEKVRKKQKSRSQKPSAVLGVFGSTYFYRVIKILLGIKQKAIEVH